MNSMYVLLCVLSPIYIFPMNKDVEIHNMSGKQVTVHYHQRWGSSFVLGVNKSIQPKARLSLDRVSRQDRLIAFTIPGFETAQDIAIKSTPRIVIKQENNNEIIISQGLDLLASIKAVNSHARRISCKTKTVRPECFPKCNEGKCIEG